MTEMGIPKNVIIFGAAMSCMEKCSRADIGFQLMKRMKEEGITPNVHIYNSAISACARSNLWEKGYELYEEMEREGVKRDVVTFNAGKQKWRDAFPSHSTIQISTHYRHI
jgi:pentatricopeptide repeat protein